MTAQQLPVYRVRAHNGAEQSENKIHDNDVARQYGFAGGLVPGVTVYAYMTRVPVDTWGRDWVERGTMSARFAKPFYEDEMVTVRGTITSGPGEMPAMELRAVNDAGEVCAIGSASLPEASGEAAELRDFPEAPLPARRPLATRSVFEGLDILGSLRAPWERVAKEEGFLAEIADDHPLYRAADGVIHPGYLIRSANAILVQNVELGPWIHVSSDVTHYSAARFGEGFTTRGRVVELFERKGHAFVVLDVLMASEAGRPLLRARHTAIYDVRKVADS